MFCWHRTICLLPQIAVIKHPFCFCDSYPLVWSTFPVLWMIKPDRYSKIMKSIFREISFFKLGFLHPSERKSWSFFVPVFWPMSSSVASSIHLPFDVELLPDFLDR